MPRRLLKTNTMGPQSAGGAVEQAFLGKETGQASGTLHGFRTELKDLMLGPPRLTLRWPRA